MTQIPPTMRVVQIRAYDGRAESISIVEMPVLHPGPGEVLVRVHASPVNPSDDLFTRGSYAFRKPLPAVPGFEGSGTVVRAGPGALPRFLRGKRVACTAAADNIAGGMWAEYVAVPAQLCVPLRKFVSLDEGATMLINPLTAWALVDEARRAGHPGIVQTAGASSVGQMVIRLARKFSIPVVNVVRRAEQVEMLRRLGAEHVLRSDDSDFSGNLRKLCHEIRASIGFDAVAGEMSSIVLKAQPRGSRLLVYGVLSMLPSQIDPGSLIFENKRVEGFYLAEWLYRRGVLARLRLARQIQSLLASDLRTDIRDRVSLQDAVGALKQYSSRMSGGKILIMP